MHGRACKQYIFWSYNIYFQCMCLDESLSTCQCRKQKGLRVSNFAFSLAIFKRCHGSEGVKAYIFVLTLVGEIRHDRNDRRNHCYYYTQNATNTIFVTKTLSFQRSS